jgi:hypothetical protein
MKKLLLFIALLCHTTFSRAQEHKPTGGCGFDFQLASVFPMPESPVCNGKNLRITLWQKVYGSEISGGSLTADIDGTEIARIDTFYPSYPQYDLVTDTIHFSTGRHILHVIYLDDGCGLFHVEQPITIDDRPTVTQPDPLPPANPFGIYSRERITCLFYPIPAKDYLFIDGLWAEEQEYKVSIITIDGRDVAVSGIARYGSLLAIPVHELPAGPYIINMATPRRSAGKLVQVLK